MATFKEVVLKHHKKEDGTYNVKVRLTHNRKVKYIDTDYYVVKQQLNSRYELKDPELQNRLNEILKDYRQEIIKLGDLIHDFDADKIKDHILNTFKRKKVHRIDFIEFCKSEIQKSKDGGQIKNANLFKTTHNAIIDYFGREIVFIDEINYNFLVSFEKYLRSERKINRINQLKKSVTTTIKGLNDAGVHHYMRDIRTLFNRAVKHYNDEDGGVYLINHYPFKKYVIGAAPKTKKRNLNPDIIKKIFDFKEFKNSSREELAKDVAMLSFYLIGMNTADIYNLKSIDGDRVSYNRAKTKGRRDDDAFISIKIEKEAWPLIEKYKDETGKMAFIFYKKYVNEDGFSTAVNKGLKSIAKYLNIEESPTTYYLRHSWATIARNNCRISKDDISLALNHVDQNNKTTDIYLEKDWTIIDEANRKVIDYINSLKK